MKYLKKLAKSIVLLTTVFMMTLTTIIPAHAEKEEPPITNDPDTVHIHYNLFV